MAGAVSSREPSGGIDFPLPQPPSDGRRARNRQPQLDSPPVSSLSFLRRAFDNLIANWPLILIRIAEQVALVLGVVLMIAAMIAPFFLAGAFELFDSLENPDEVLEQIMSFESLLTIAASLAILLVGSILLLAVHAFVESGVTGCYIDGERSAAGANPPRRSFAVFTPERWLRHARARWWHVFLIYNITWGIFGIIVMLPLAVAAAIVAVGRENPFAIVAGCAVAVAAIFGLILIGVLVSLWTHIAVACAIVRSGSVRESLRLSVTSLRRQWLAYLIAFVVTFAVSGGVGMVMFFMSTVAGALASLPHAGIAFVPLQILVSVAQAVASLVVSSWLVAAVAAIVTSQEGGETGAATGAVTVPVV